MLNLMIMCQLVYCKHFDRQLGAIPAAEIVRKFQRVKSLFQLLTIIIVCVCVLGVYSGFVN